MSTGADALATSDRDRVLRAMADSCARRGFAETTVAEVIERAGVSEEEFDALFASKEDCALAAINKIVSEAVSRISIADGRGGDPVQRRLSEAHSLADLLADSPAFASLGLIEARQGGTQRMRDAYESALRVLALMIERREGRRTGQARAMLGGAEAVVRRELVRGRAAALPQLLENLVYGVLVASIGQGEALRQAKQATGMAGEEGK